MLGIEAEGVGAWKSNFVAEGGADLRITMME